MNIAELPGILQKHVGMLKAQAGQALENPGLKAMQDRQSIYHDTLDKRAEIYDKTMGSERPLLEQVLGVAPSADYAVSRQHELFGMTGDDGGEGDTFRHQALSADLQQKFPKYAQDFGDLHEMQGHLGGQSPQEESRDYGNNLRGRTIGKYTNNRQEAETMIRATMPRSTPNVQSWGPLKMMQERQAIWGK